MTRVRLAALAVTAAIVTAVALVGQAEPKTSAGKMQRPPASSSRRLSPELKKKATFGFDDPHRTEVVSSPRSRTRRRSSPARACGSRR